MSNELSTHIEDQEKRGQHNLMEVAASRQAQEVQAMIVIAKRFPRDVNESISRITTACQRRGLAEVSMYSYPRGKEQVTGPSIRLAEAMAQGWGNLDYGIRELSQANGESVCEAYAWDMETNVRSATTFTVPHVRHTKQGSYLLKDPRDIAEMILNVGARRKRSCILSVIPKDVQDLAVEQCEKTLTEGHKEPLVDRVRKMLEVFKQFGITTEMIETRAQRKTESLTEQHMLELRKIYTSLKDGMSKPEDWFAFQQVETEGTAKTPGESKSERAAKELKREKGSKKEKETAKSEPQEEEKKEKESTTTSEPQEEEKKETKKSESEPEVIEEIPEDLREYHFELFKTATLEQARQVWRSYIFDNKETMDQDLYSLACEYRDQKLKTFPAE